MIRNIVMLSPFICFILPLLVSSDDHLDLHPKLLVYRDGGLVSGHALAANDSFALACDVTGLHNVTWVTFYRDGREEAWMHPGLTIGVSKAELSTHKGDWQCKVTRDALDGDDTEVWSDTVHVLKVKPDPPILTVDPNDASIRTFPYDYSKVTFTCVCEHDDALLTLMKDDEEIGRGGVSSGLATTFVYPMFNLKPSYSGSYHCVSKLDGVTSEPSESVSIYVKKEPTDAPTLKAECAVLSEAAGDGLVTLTCEAADGAKVSFLQDGAVIRGQSEEHANNVTAGGDGEYTCTAVAEGKGVSPPSEAVALPSCVADAKPSGVTGENTGNNAPGQGSAVMQKTLLLPFVTVLLFLLK